MNQPAFPTVPRAFVAAAFALAAPLGPGAAELQVTAAGPGYELRVTDRPIVQRGFLPDASPRSVAVGLPGGISYCFDTESGSLRYAWSGGFLDLKPTWHERGASPPNLLGTRFFTAPAGTVWRLNESDPAVTLRFRGYELVQGLPVFRFTVAGTEIRQRLDAADGGLRIRLERLSGTDPLQLRVPAGLRVQFARSGQSAGPADWVALPAATSGPLELFLPGPASAGSGEASKANPNPP
jgi:hypothetical protein